MGTHEFSPLRREEVAISGNREWLRREWKQHDDQSFIFGGRSGDGASFLRALLSVDNNVGGRRGATLPWPRAHERPPAPQNSRAPTQPRNATPWSAPGHCPCPTIPIAGGWFTQAPQRPVALGGARIEAASCRTCLWKCAVTDQRTSTVREPTNGRLCPLRTPVAP